jgi:hypothetical protein
MMLESLSNFNLGMMVRRIPVSIFLPSKYLINFYLIKNFLFLVDEKNFSDSQNPLAALMVEILGHC